MFHHFSRRDMSNQITKTKPALLAIKDIPMHELEGWAISADQLSIQKKFAFKDFEQAFAFMKNCYEPIEEMNHHPDWSNVYSTVNVTLNTHDSGGITHKDIALAKTMNQIFENIK
jgi:4a-hydroxytetrahydrobiopterin dehydratase